MREVGESRTVHANPWFSVSETPVQVDGVSYDYYWVRKADSVLVMPRVRGTGRWLVLDCWRPTFPGSRSIEFVQGGIEADEDPSAAAKRELLEETGYRAVSLEKLGVLQEAAGFATSCIHVFAAEAVHATQRRPEPLEADDRVLAVEAKYLSDAVRECRMVDAASVAALTLHGRSEH